jgi:hypothetical protein
LDAYLAERIKYEAARLNAGGDAAGADGKLGFMPPLPGLNVVLPTLFSLYFGGFSPNNLNQVLTMLGPTAQGLLQHYVTSLTADQATNIVNGAMPMIRNLIQNLGSGGVNSIMGAISEGLKGLDIAGAMVDHVVNDVISNKNKPDPANPEQMAADWQATMGPGS